MTDTVLVLASGKSHRWNGINKLYLNVCGEPILTRTTRLIKEIRPDIQLIITGSEATYPTPNQVITHYRNAWAKDGRTFVLLGDVSWRKSTLEKVLKEKNGFTIFGRSGPNKLTGRPYKEIFAMVWDHGDNDAVAGWHKDAVRFNPTGDWWDVVMVSDLKKTGSIVYSFMRLFACPAIYMQYLRMYGRMETHPAFKDVGESITDDIDEPEWYQPYLDAVEPKRLIDT